MPEPASAIYMIDKFPNQETLDAAVSPQLTDLWAQTTVLSIAARDYENATRTAVPDTQELTRVRDYLLNYRKDLPSTNSTVAREVEKLLAKIKERLDT